MAGQTQNKTQPTAVGVADYIASLPEPARREDAEAAVALLTEATGLEPVMWGASIIGFGKYRYRYESGREGESALVGFSPRKGNLVFYMALGDRREALLGRLGKHKSEGGCVYLKRLADADPAVLGEMARTSMAHYRAQYPD